MLLGPFEDPLEGVAGGGINKEAYRMNNLPWQIEKIIEVANCLQATGSTAASTGERIAAAFVLNRLDYLPDTYSDAVEAWDRLGGDWQDYVRLIKGHYMDCIEGGHLDP